ncbi:MAG: heparan N-sulfatase [Planctomycetaceae bacterium]|nr:heparan N-sulfatase [Planctomycetaceae bacterium]
MLIVFVLLLGYFLVSQSAQAQRPNILFAISDDQSFPHASAYGTKGIETPVFDRVAREGILFNNVFAASPGCSPCRAALLTGRHTWQIEHAGTHASSFSSKYVTFPDLLESAGYHIGYTGKGWGPGNFKAGGRTRNPAGPSYSKITTKPPHGGIRSTDYAANFEKFLSDRKDGQPFCFWYGGSEPHRGFEKGVGLKVGKKLADALVPKFLPDTPEIRSDILDYYVEIEWFDKHLGRMLDLLEKSGELDNTLIIVTSDNGMAFPRAKANCYEYGIHMPLAIRWGKAVQAGREVDDLVGFVDLTATMLDAADVKHPSKQYPLAGRSIMNILKAKKSGLVDDTRTAVFSARERHSSSRYGNLAYPQRCIRTQQFLLTRNFRPNRWPAGTPQKFDKPGVLGPMHGGYHDIDACPSLTFLIEHREDESIKRFFHWSVDKRPELELFDIKSDPACLNNLAYDRKYKSTRNELNKQLTDYLTSTGDPRILDGGDIFETYKRYSRIRTFPKPE